MMRERGDLTEAMRAKPMHQLDGLSLDFGSTTTPTIKPDVIVPPEVPGWATRWASLTKAERVAQQDRWKALLLPVVLELAATREDFIASDVIAVGAERGLLNTERPFLKLHPRIYSFIGTWLGLLAERGTIARHTIPLPNGGVWQLQRKADRSLSHSNKNLCFTRAA